MSLFSVKIKLLQIVMQEWKIHKGKNWTSKYFITRTSMRCKTDAMVCDWMECVSTALVFNCTASTPPGPSWKVQSFLFTCPKLGPPLASRASRCSALQPGTVYLLHYAPPDCRWATSSAGWRLSFSSTREPSSGAVVTDQRVRRRTQIFRLNSTQCLQWTTLASNTM